MSMVDVPAREARDAPEKAPRVFWTVDDVVKYFRKNPALLVAYVEKGLRGRYVVPGIHIAQLASAVDIRLLSDGVTYGSLPEILMSPADFDNIREIIGLGHQRWS